MLNYLQILIESNSANNCTTTAIAVIHCCSALIIMANWKRYRLKTYAVEDYRPLVFNEKYPWWCSGYGENSTGEYAVIIAYLPNDEDLLKYWDDAFEVEFTEEDNISFSSRFPKPEYFVES